MTGLRTCVFGLAVFLAAGIATADFSIDTRSNFNGPTHARVQEILDPVHDLLLKSLSSAPRHTIQVYVRPQGPKVDLVRNVQRIGLSAQQHFYMQYAYQYAHELGHVLTQWQDSDEYRFKWFEETLCELASLYVIHSFAQSRPYGLFSKEQWMGYLNSVESNQVDSRWRIHRIDSTTRTRTWFPRLQRAMEQNSLIRELNGAIAFELLPHFVERPELWEAVAYVNRWDTSRDRSFNDYLSSWTVTLVQNGKDVDAARLVGTVIYGR